MSETDLKNWNEKIEDRVTKLEQENQGLQAKIDSLMLEYCPNEMTEEQKKNWAKHQVVAQNKE